MRATEYAGVGPTAAASELRVRALRDLAEGRFEPWVCPSVPLAAVRVRALVDQGRPDVARAELARVTVDDMRSWSAADLVSAAYAASRVGPAQRCRDLLTVAAERGGVGADQSPRCVSTMFVRAQCMAALGHSLAAQEAFDDALVGAETADPVAGAQVRAELGRFHLGAGPTRARSARAHLMAAAVCLRANGLANLADRATAMLEGDGPVGMAGPQRGVLRPGERWLAGFGLSVAVEIDAHPGLDVLRTVLVGGCRSVVVDEPARQRVTHALGALDEVVPEMADHVRQSVTFVSGAASYRPVDPVRWALDPRPSCTVPPPR